MKNKCINERSSDIGKDQSKWGKQIIHTCSYVTHVGKLFINPPALSRRIFELW